MGIPVVAGVADPDVRALMVQRWDGLPFYEASDTDTLYDALRMLVESEQARREWAERGTRHVERFHEEDRVVPLLQDLYRNAPATLPGRQREAEDAAARGRRLSGAGQYLPRRRARSRSVRASPGTRLMAPPVMTDPTGALLVEIRDYLAAEGVTTRVRPTEPEPGDARRFGEYVRFVVLVALSLPPDPMLPTMDATFAVRCYGTNPVDASLVWRYVADAVHRIGPRVGTSGHRHLPLVDDRRHARQGSRYTTAVHEWSDPPSRHDPGRGGLVRFRVRPDSNEKGDRCRRRPP
jgi:hypothetical protein